MITDKQIARVLKDFDFVKVAKIYKSMKWKWATLNAIPDEKDLRKSAKTHLVYLQNNYPKITDIHSGGLRASAYQEEGLYTVVQLEFIAHTSVAS